MEFWNAMMIWLVTVALWWNPWFEDVQYNTKNDITKWINSTTISLSKMVDIWWSIADNLIEWENIWIIYFAKWKDWSNVWILLNWTNYNKNLMKWYKTVLYPWYNWEFVKLLIAPQWNKIPWTDNFSTFKIIE